MSSEEMGSSKRLRRSHPSSGSGGNDDHDSGGEDDDGRVTKGTWCKEEDDRLLEAVQKYGTDNWKAVSQVVTGRSAKQCRDRYKLKLDPTINHGPWTKAEDDRLIELSQEYGRAWTKIARHMPGRTENAVKSRISSLERSRTKDWSPEEDALLTELKKKNVDFEQMVEHFPNRSVHAIKKHWETLHMDELARKLRQDLSNGGASQSAAPTPAPAPVVEVNQQPLVGQQFLYHSAMNPQQAQQSAAPSIPTFPSAMPLMLPFNGGQMPLLNPAKFPPNFPQQLSQAPVHPGVAQTQSRLARHSTSMTVLLQVLGENPAGGPGRLTASPMREHTSFTLPSADATIATGSDVETPKQQLLQALGFFNTEQKE